jgi:hypothetical protein
MWHAGYRAATIVRLRRGMPRPISPPSLWPPRLFDDVLLKSANAYLHLLGVSCLRGGGELALMKPYGWRRQASSGGPASSSPPTPSAPSGPLLKFTQRGTFTSSSSPTLVFSASSYSWSPLDGVHGLDQEVRRPQLC